ncbi:Alpha/Beta hydrolase protein [Trametes polyzona]|nr:Alpha/Beta hydrolase protein [Trametes polyzona]
MNVQHPIDAAHAQNTSKMPPAMDPELAAAFAAGPPLDPSYVPTVSEARQLITNIPLKAFLEPRLPPASTYTVKDHTVPVNGGEITVRAIVPVVEDPSETFPVLVFLHGGWCVGDLDQDDYPLRLWAVELKISIVNVDYRLAPEHPFPVPVDDSMAALKWTATHTDLLKGDLTKGFIVAGDSAGGNMSAVLSHEARDDPFFQQPGRQLTGQLLWEPLVVQFDAYPEEYKSELNSSKENVVPGMVHALLGWYNAPPTDPRASPLLYPSHRNLPRAFVLGAELDPLRDDARLYTKVLQAAGVETRYIEYPGVTHSFHYVAPYIKAAAKVREDAVEGIKWLLGRESKLQV